VSETARSRGVSTIGIVLLVVGLVLLVIGIVYFTVPLDKLPAFLGRGANSTAHHTKRALAGVVGGVVFLIGAAFVLIRSRAR
jgi:hypothetical protein